MSFYTLGTGLTAANRVDPSGLTYKPYTSTNSVPRKVIEDWTTQAKKGILPLGNLGGLGDAVILLRFVPSVPGATMVVTFSEFNPTSQTFAPRQDDTSATLVGETTVPVYNPSYEMIYPWLNSVSSGTVSIYVEGRNAEVS